MGFLEGFVYQPAKVGRTEIFPRRALDDLDILDIENIAGIGSKILQAIGVDIAARLLADDTELVAIQPAAPFAG